MSKLVFIGAIISVFQAIGLYVKNTNAICCSKKRLDGQTVLVTGGTAGIGLEIAQDLAQRGARVIVASRSNRAMHTIARCSDNQNIVFKLLDLASLESTRKFAADILNTEDRLDILINNAGAIGSTTTATTDGLDFVMQVNYYGAFLLTILLLPLLKKTGCPGEPSRIVNVSSVAHRFGVAAKDSRFAVRSYANSKICVVLFSRELTKRLKDCNVVINNSDPGVVGTKIFLTNRLYLGWIATFLCYILSKTPWHGAQTALHVALDRKAGEVSGEYFKNCELTRAVSRAYNDKSAMKLWEESVRLVKLTDQELEQCLKSP